MGKTPTEIEAQLGPVRAGPGGGRSGAAAARGRSWKSIFFLKLSKFWTRWARRMVDTVLENWDVVLSNERSLVNICWPFWSTNWLWITYNFGKKRDFGKTWCCHVVNISQQMLTKIVLTKSLMPQPPKNVPGVPQSILDSFLISCEETQHF